MRFIIEIYNKIIFLIRFSRKMQIKIITYWKIEVV